MMRYFYIVNILIFITLSWEISCQQSTVGNDQSSAESKTISTPTPAANVPLKRGLRMSKIAKEHLSDEKNPNNMPKLLGIDFPGKYVGKYVGTGTTSS